MVETLGNQGSLTPEQAECVTVKLFDDGGYLQEQLDQVASGFTNDDGSEKVKGFEADAAAAIDDCIRQ